MKSPKIRIPKKYKQNLDDRFNPEKAKFNKEYGFWKIAIQCKLCRDFGESDDASCGRCPFAPGLGGDGCMRFMRKAAGVRGATGILFDVDNSGIYWPAEDNKQARTQLQKLRREAQKMIEWV